MTAVPVGTTAKEALAAIRDGRVFVADIRGARNPKQHDLFWTLCELVAETEDDNKDNVKRWLLHALGYVDTWFDPSGAMHVETRSIAFEAMTQAEFNRFFQAAVAKIAERLQCAPPEVQARFDELVNPLRGS